MTPFIEVSHLPSATSFYSAVVQPLGLKAIASSLESDSTFLPTAVGFGGVDNAAVFEIRQTSNPLKPPRLSSLTLAVPSNSAVTRFHKSWLKTEPPSWSLFRDNRGLEKLPGERHRALQGPWSVQEGGKTAVRAIIFDQDGNKLEAWCPGTTLSRPGALEVVKWTNPFDRQISQQDFPIHSRTRSQLTSNASSEHSRPQITAMRPPQMSPAHNANYTSGPSTRSSQEETAASQDESSYGGAFNTTTMVGALLGAAAGAALTYGYVTGNKDPIAGEEHEPQRTRVLPRRATFPEKPVTAHRYPHRRAREERDLDGSSIPRRFSTADTRHLPSGDCCDDAMDDDNVSYGVEPVDETRYLTYPPLPASVASHTYTRAPSTARPLDNGGDLRDHRSRVSTHAPDGAREYRSRPPSRVFEDTHDRRSRPPSSVAEETHDRRSRPPSRVAEDASARRSRPSSRVSGRRNSGRAQSEVAHERVRHSAYDHERDYQSVAALPRRAPGSTVSRPPLTRVFRPQYESDQETFVSARSHHSASTVRSRDRPTDREHGRDLGHEFHDYEAVTREHRTPRSEMSAATLREASRERSRRGSSRVSARNVPLPRSMVGSSHANWNPWDVPLPMSGVGSSHADWDDDMVSLAPSDSISCVGSKAHRSRKQRY